MYEYNCGTIKQVVGDDGVSRFFFQLGIAVNGQTAAEVYIGSIDPKNPTIKQVDLTGRGLPVPRLVLD